MKFGKFSKLQGRTKNVLNASKTWKTVRYKSNLNIYREKHLEWVTKLEGLED